MQPDHLNGLPRGQSGLQTLGKEAVPCLVFFLGIKKNQMHLFKVKLDNTWTFMLKHLVSLAVWPGYPAVWYVLVNVHEGEI